VQAELLRGDCSTLPLPDACVDLVFCHQTFHHLVHQERTLAEFYRILKPGGLLLFAESTREYINTWCIRFLFRHPMEVQRSAEEYLVMIRRAGFVFEEQNVLLPYYWWSRTTMKGVQELLRLRRMPRPVQRKETLVYMAGVKPA
ncbi:MAG: class I SAM-dependent methyltransferase, partial [Gammaproteobacteria bacterium]